MPLEFNRFADQLQELLKGPLPGSLAHEPLRAIPSGSVIPKFNHTIPPRPGSVLILLYPNKGIIQFPLTKRNEYLGAHSGQISLPGGKAEPGESAEQTALREGQEEIGIDPSRIKIIGKLSDFFVIPSNFMVKPVVGVQSEPPLFAPDPHEVDKILQGSIQDLIKDDAVKVKEIMAARIFPLTAPHFLIEDEVVWGATAMMLNELRLLIRQIDR